MFLSTFTLICLGVYRSLHVRWLNCSPRRSTATIRSVLPATATTPSGHASDENGAACSRGSYDSGDRANLLARSKWPSQGLEDNAIIAALPCTDTALSLGGLAPRKRARVSLSCPVTESTSARRSTPLERPTLR